MTTGAAHRQNGNAQWLGAGLVVLAALCWSTAGYFVTGSLRGSGLQPLGLAFWRVLCAFLALFVVLVAFRRDLLRITRRNLLWAAGMGVLAVGVFQVLWILSIVTNGASLATVVQSNAPIIVALLARVFWREPLTWRKWVALLLAFVGTALVAQISATGNLQLTPVGLLIALGSAFAYAGITLFTKKLTDNGVNAWTILVYSFGFAALALLPLQLGQPPLSLTGWQPLAFFAGLVLITTIAGYALYSLSLRHLQASIAAILALVEVPFAAAFAFVFLGERMNAIQIAGALAVLAGVLLIAMDRAPRPAVERPAIEAT
ncbi:MAG: DMT family transporter [Anaerolineae bacterium]|jgi:drug/metabolite transporter (DMT)-like permease|nr:DMT family transporter [Anaerolineae bacterium]